jgi:hypothetical protein
MQRWPRTVKVKDWFRNAFYRGSIIASKKATFGKGVMGAHRLGGYLAPLDTSSIQLGITATLCKGRVVL